MIKNPATIPTIRNPFFYGKLFQLVVFMLLFNAAMAQVFTDASEYNAMQGVQLEATSDEGGGMNVGWIDHNDWIDYVVNIPLTGQYRADFRVSSPNTARIIQVSKGAETVMSVTVPNTGGWQNWSTLQGDTIPLESGEYTFRIRAISGGYNLNWWQLVLIDPADSDSPAVPELTKAEGTVHDVMLEWDKPDDPSTFIGGYRFFEGDKMVAITAGQSITFSKLPHNREFNYSLVAFDIAGNVSDTLVFPVSTLDLPWEVKWFEDFNEDGAPETAHWNYQIGGGGWGNNEVQYYTNGQNVWIEDGNMIIEARQEQFGSNPFTSTRMNTSGKVDMLYGRLEVRARLPRTGGTWPAIWMMPTASTYGGWPNSGEIDIMEHTGNNYGHVFGTIHTGAYNHIQGTQQGGGIDIENVTDVFHTYTLEWYPDYLDWYIDDVHIFHFANEYESPAEWPFNRPFHLILNIAIGGNLGGTINYNGEWPQQMVVDYIKMYDFKLHENDTVAPEQVTNLAVIPKWNTAEASWFMARDNAGVDLYRVFLDGELAGTTRDVTWSFQDLDPLTDYTLGVQTVDLAGNESEIKELPFSTTEVVAFSVPGRIQAEDYTQMQGVQTETTSDAGGGVNVGWIDSGDWLTYTVYVAETGLYTISYRYASTSANRSVVLQDSQGNNLVTTPFNNTGDWQGWQTAVSSAFTLQQGQQTIRVTTSTGGFNLNWLEIKEANTTGDMLVPADLSTPTIYPIPFNGNKFNLDIPGYSGVVDITIFDKAGRKIEIQRMENFSSSASISNLSLAPGTYILAVTTQRKTITRLLIVI